MNVSFSTPKFSNKLKYGAVRELVLHPWMFPVPMRSLWMATLYRSADLCESSALTSPLHHFEFRIGLEPE